MKKATLEDAVLITNILTDAFKENKSIINVTRKGKNQLKRIRKLMYFFFLKAYYNGNVFLSNNEKACVLILTNGEKRTFNLKVKFLFFYWYINLLFNVLGVRNVKNVLERENVIKANHPKEPFLHLYYVGVFKENQGNGIGTSLINKVIKSYVNYKIVYLETSDKRNIKLYEKLGFNLVNTHNELEITLYIMKKQSNF